MDTALVLKQKVDSGEITHFAQAAPYLDKSEIVGKLFADINCDILNLINRLTEFSEIPFANRLTKVQEWTNKLADRSFCGDGFSITGKSDDILSCYNSMVTSILIRLGYSNIVRIDKGIEWILNFQNIQRGAENKWTGSGILKYGGCLKAAPCFIGVVKAMIALSDYKKRYAQLTNKRIEKKLAQGLDYILDHQLYMRLSNKKPITRDITKLTYPFTYKTNILEILRLMRANNLDADKRCIAAKDYLLSKRKKDGFWRVNSSYLPEAWIKFDNPNEPGLWINYEISKLIDTAF